MYDPLWENHPKVKQIKAQAKIDAEEAVKEAKAKAEAEGKATLAAAKAKAAAILRSAERVERLLERAEARAEQAQREAQARAEQAQREAQARAEQARAEQARAATKELRDAVLLIVKARFPDLAEAARERLTSIEQTEVLKYLIEQISLAPDEKYVRWLLRPPVA